MRYYLNASQAPVALHDGQTAGPGQWVACDPSAVAGLPAMRLGLPRRSVRQGLPGIAPTPSPAPATPEAPAEPVPVLHVEPKKKKDVKLEAPNG